MADHEKDCLLCGEEIVYSKQMQKVTCSLCGQPFESQAVCRAGHFVCDACHSEKVREEIRCACLDSEKDDAADIAAELMALPWVHMHGPEHHFLVAAALLTSYYRRRCEKENALPLEEALGEAMKRCAKTPGGACGLWGCCGAAVGAGIFASIITETTPLSGESWGEANLLTAGALTSIARVGGPRCCKRDSLLAVLSAAAFAKEHWHIKLTEKNGMICAYFKNNRECIGRKCPFNRKEETK